MHFVINPVVDSLPVFKIAGYLEQWAVPIPDLSHQGEREMRRNQLIAHHQVISTTP
jgi:hypothetical protein